MPLSPAHPDDHRSTSNDGAGPADVVRRAYEALQRGAIDEWVAMWTDDVEFRQTSAVPWGGTYRGKEECLEFLRRAAEGIKSLAGPDEPLFVSGDEVVAIGRSRGTALLTGRRFDIRVVHAWRVRGEQIAGWTLYVDTDVLVEALTAR
jgi:ketosteroid isomerase-like protein